MEQTPSVGRIVHYVNRGTADGMFQPTCRAAIVTEADGSDTILSMTIHNPHGDSYEKNVRWSPSNEPHTWHWPERV